MSELPPQPDPEHDKTLAEHTPPAWIIRLAMLTEGEEDYI